MDLMKAFKERKPEVKMAMVIDDYKLKNKEDWWAKALNQIPGELLSQYELDREETGQGITKDTTILYRYYRLKEESNG